MRLRHTLFTSLPVVLYEFSHIVLFVSHDRTCLRLAFSRDVHLVPRTALLLAGVYASMFDPRGLRPIGPSRTYPRGLRLIGPFVGKPGLSECGPLATQRLLLFNCTEERDPNNLLRPLVTMVKERGVQTTNYVVQWSTVEYSGLGPSGHDDVTQLVWLVTEVTPLKPFGSSVMMSLATTHRLTDKTKRNRSLETRARATPRRPFPWALKRARPIQMWHD
eukprot:1190288-Prorocentrum_minimum.AAC.2